MTAIRHFVAVCAIGAALATPRAQEPQRPGNGVTAPTVVKRVNPEYTQEALAERIQGTVGLSIVVRPDGTVGDVEVTKSLDSVHGLDRQAIDAMKQWEFKPGMKDGKPVAARVDVQMTFTLK
jgi:TonB family protein